MAHPDRDDRERSPLDALNDIGRDIRKGRPPRPEHAPDHQVARYGAVTYPTRTPVLDRPERTRQGEPTAPGFGPELDWDPTGRDDSIAARARLRRTLAQEHPQESQPGLPAVLALGVLLVIAGAGGLIDMASGSTVRGWFNIGFIVASIVAILVVRRRSMFPIVVAPPIIYACASGAIIYLRSGGLSNRSVLLDGAANWLIYGFPSLAAATAAVLIIAGLRTILRK